MSRIVYVQACWRFAHLLLNKLKTYPPDLNEFLYAIRYDLFNTKTTLTDSIKQTKQQFSIPALSVNIEKRT